MRTSRVAAPIMILLIGAVAAACSASTGGAGGLGTSAAAATTAPTVAPVATAVATVATATTGSAAPATGSSDSSGGYTKGGYGTAPTPPAAAGLAVNLGDTSLGKVLVDGAGMTLYAFTPDSAGKSVCNGTCATNWPPLQGAGAPTLGAGLTASDFTSITRDDGSAQVAFHGMPLYHFSGDSAKGDVNGQGIGTKWYVVGADGKLIK